MAKLTLGTLTSAYNAVAQLNANNALIEAAFENTLSRDGTTPNTMSADFDMNSNKVLNVAAGVAAADAVNYQQVQDLLAAAGSAAIATPIAATLVSIVDAGGFFTAIEVEGALAELGALDQLPAPVSAGRIAVVNNSGTAWIEAADNFLYSQSSGQVLIKNLDNWGVLTFLDSGGGATGFTLSANTPGDLILFGTGGNEFLLSGPNLVLNDGFYLAAQITPDPDKTFYGQLYVRSTDDQLYYKHDGVPEVALTGAASNQGVMAPKTGSTNRANDATLTADPDLQLTLEPGDYYLEGFINWGQSGGGASGIRYRMAVLSGSISNGVGSLLEADQVATADGQCDLLVLDPGGSTRIRNNTDLDNHRGHYRGFVTVNTTAVIAFEWGQNISNPAQVGIGPGYLYARKIA